MCPCDQGQVVGLCEPHLFASKTDKLTDLLMIKVTKNKLCSRINLVWYFKKMQMHQEESESLHAEHHVLNALTERGSFLDSDGAFPLNLPVSQQLKISWLYCTLSFFSASPH